MRNLQGLLMACLFSASAGGWAAAAAEFSIRWDPAEGGPATVNESLSALGLKAAGPDTFVVQYFTVNQPQDAPAGFKAIARERRSGSQVETTYKLRGPAPFPANAAHLKECPLKGPAEAKSEVDITWTADEVPRRAYSRSCTAKADLAHALPPAFGAKALGCSSKMRRYSVDAVKLELWELPGGTQVFEVSSKGKDSASDLKRFRKRIVVPLLNGGVKPLKDSKTELGSAC